MGMIRLLLDWFIGYILGSLQWLFYTEMLYSRCSIYGDWMSQQNQHNTGILEESWRIVDFHSVLESQRN